MGGGGRGVALATFKSENVLSSLSEKPAPCPCQRAGCTLLPQHWTEARRRPRALQGAPTELLPGETDSLLLDSLGGSE